MKERYPPWYKTREEYSDKVGDVRELMLAQIFRDFGFKVVRSRTRGIDLKIYHEESLIALIEVSNEWHNSYYDTPTQVEKVTLFNKHQRRNARRLWICSFAASLDAYLLGAFGIEVVELGFQTLEDRDYEWFKDKEQHYGREPTTTAYEKTKIAMNKLIEEHSLYH